VRVLGGIVSALVVSLGLTYVFWVVDRLLVLMLLSLALACAAGWVLKPGWMYSLALSTAYYLGALGSVALLMYRGPYEESATFMFFILIWLSPVVIVVLYTFVFAFSGLRRSVRGRQH
jgi:hypothetical protein